MKKLVVVTLCLICAVSFAAPLMTLKDAIGIALKNQENILQGEQSLLSAKYRLTGAKSDYYPQVSVNFVQGILNSNSKVTSSSNLNANMNFYDGGQRELKVKGAKINIDSSTSNLERTRQTVINNVTSAYFTLLRTKKQNDVIKSQLQFLNGELDLIKARVDAGDAAAVEILPIEATAANARVDLLTSNNNIRAAAMKLQDAMGVSITGDFDVVDYAPKLFTIDPLESYLNTAKTIRPEVIETKSAVASAQVNVDLAKLQARVLPQVSGQLSQPLIGGGKSNYLVTAGVVFTVFDGGANKASINEAKTSLESALIHQNQTDKDIQSDVQLAYINVQSSVERIAASDLSLKAAKANNDAQEERYKLGLATSLDLLNAQNDVISAQFNSVQANFDYYIYIGQLEYATGKQGVLYAE